jgi:hypothetical protein
LSQVETLISKQKKAIRNKEDEIARASRGIETSQDNIEKHRTLLPEGSSAMSRLANKEGAFRTERRTQDGELTQLKFELDSLEIYKKDVDNDLTCLEGADNYFKLGSLHTISYSSFREKFAVRTLGRTQAKTYTRGPRTVAGSMVFTVFQEHDFLRMIKNIDTSNEKHPHIAMLDQIAPFNLMLLFANEYGAYSVLHLFDVELSSEGQQMSVDQIITHNTMNFYATDMIPMTSVGNTFNSYSDMINELAVEIGDRGIKSANRATNRPIDTDINRFSNSDGDKVLREMLAESRGLF